MQPPLFELALPPPPSHGADASLLGSMTLRNHFTLWMISSGNGEALNMTKAEFDAFTKSGIPRCMGHVDGEPPMLARGTSWVCYRHDPPIRLRRAIAPAIYAPGRVEDHLNDIMDAVQNRDGTWSFRKERFR